MFTKGEIKNIVDASTKVESCKWWLLNVAGNPVNLRKINLKN